ncbi:hypothetical protein ASPWEDRAFT_115406 [Aspergillus wentii DTO 134E9]|uniref:LysM domain-containing protein n=1 Tax=Aspergillus wentii DTO 134E9 TaxID=1073089 RepID=A0A1L9REA1_ASPWE|nr:uncharacterized protein ASPWEDRAFT_115406 [Aspergillus wentii DTO 134E9]KAI9933466.1 hypothetical protein MW887_007939 [Aspergillus wentii]OJJ33208.1 hypothetical protein ASPWEDRAFT_115406 [Aspergillus wentii DTO 134E9]
MSSNGGFLEALSPGITSTTNTSRRSTSTVRSRTRRLASSEDDVNTSNGAQQLSSGLSRVVTPDLSTTASRGTTPSPFPSRGVSPLPRRHPSRANESPNNRGRINGSGASSGGFSHNGKDQLNLAESSRAAADFLDASWSSLQSLASSVLGSDIARPASNGSAKGHQRKPSRPDPYLRDLSKQQSSWGPSGPSTSEIGAGTKEERQAYVQAKKREALLLADTCPSTSSNTRHKRRDSSDQTGYSSIDHEQDEDALAYIHHVQPTDTITGVTIKYGCQPAIFRKANGFWPSDSIQSRKTVLLPVDSCSVKGRPIRPADTPDLLSDETPGRASIEDPNGSSIAPEAFAETRTSKDEASASTTSEVEGDRIWKHESFVQIDGFPSEVEIGRVPRRALGFFPRTRRKSVSYTDSEPPPSISGREPATTASTSTSSSPVQPSASRYTDFPENRPHAGSSGSTSHHNPKPSARHQRQRSNVQLSGPGVGTLDRDTMAPGPALDGFSKFFAQHLPNLAPQPAPPNFQAASESTATSNTPTSLDNLGGAFEGWVKKMTTRAKASFNELQQPSTQSYQINGRGPISGGRGMGDLIELDDGLEARGSSGLAETRRKPELSRSGSSLQDTTSLRGRPSASATSRTRDTGRQRSNYSEDGVKDD